MLRWISGGLHEVQILSTVNSVGFRPRTDSPPLKKPSIVRTSLKCPVLWF